MSDLRRVNALAIEFHTVLRNVRAAAGLLLLSIWRPPRMIAFVDAPWAARRNCAFVKPLMTALIMVISFDSEMG
jgi:hypothetical protein